MASVMTTTVYGFEMMTSYTDKDWEAAEITDEILFALAVTNPNFHEIGTSGVSINSESGVFTFDSEGTYSIEISGNMSTPGNVFGHGIINLQQTDDDETSWDDVHSISHYHFSHNYPDKNHLSTYYYRTNIYVDDIAADGVRITADADGINLSGTTNIIFSELVEIPTQGEKGDKGDQGDAGAAGADGVDGDTGPKGATGATGAQGPTGKKGDTGEKGDKGDAGTDGARGPQGEQGSKGDMGQSGQDGNNYDSITNCLSRNQTCQTSGTDGIKDNLIIEPKNKYNKKTADLLINYSVDDGDQINLLLKEDHNINNMRFKCVNGKNGLKKYASRKNNLIYCKRNNSLYLDLNGAGKGFGEGGMVAKIDDCPDKSLINIVSIIENSNNTLV